MLFRPYESRVPDALDAVKAAFTAAFAGPEQRVFVRDGPWTAADASGRDGFTQDIAIGWYGFYPGYQYPTRSLSEEMGEAAVTGTNTEQGWAPGQAEDFTVGCASIISWGEAPSPETWSLLRHMTYGNIAAVSRFMAVPENGERYLADQVEKLVIARQHACHHVAQRRGVLCIVTFSLDCTTTSQQ